MKLLLFTCILILGLSACRNDNKTSPSDDRLISNKWIFKGIKQTKVNFESVPHGLTGMDITFTKFNNFHANSSCNTIDGYYTTDKSSIRIDSLSLTKIFCSDSIVSTWEDKYVSGLKNSKEFKISNDSLSIGTNLNTELIFKASSQN
jgi:heat shock protein HslJ